MTILKPTRRGFLGLFAPAIVTAAGYRAGLWTPPRDLVDISVPETTWISPPRPGIYVPGSTFYMGRSALSFSSDGENYLHIGDVKDLTLKPLPEGGYEAEYEMDGHVFGIAYAHAKIETPEFSLEMKGADPDSSELVARMVSEFGEIKSSTAVKTKFTSGMYVQKKEPKPC